MKASQLDGTHPRPLLVRERWTSLDGSWEFAHDDADVGLGERWQDPAGGHAFADRIEVPYPPESPASGIGRREIHPVVWYRRELPLEAVTTAPGQRLLLHLGAVDHEARVWVDGTLVASHSGGATPITADVTDALAVGEGPHVLVVRAEDDATDPDQGRGKQDWRERTRGIWYERTTGIWQTVWLEAVPADHVADLVWTPDLAAGVVHGTAVLSRRPRAATLLEVTATLGEEVLAQQSVLVQDRVVELDLRIDALRNGQDRARLLWSPEHPVLVDLEVRLRAQGSGEEVDAVASYTGLRSVSVDGGGFRLNDHPYYLRAVLNQGYRPQTHLAATGTEELRTEVERIRAMGFNCSRNHQKSEDPRWLYWADRLGLLVWAEAAAHYGYSPRAAEAHVAEWTALVRRDRSHPSVCLWVPVNESWGVPDIASDPAQQQYVRGLASLTRALDPSRPVVSNEGWEHVDSDLLGLHDYTADPEELRRRYATTEAVREVVLAGRTPHGRRSVLGAEQVRAFEEGRTPVMVTEFGGVSLGAVGEAGDAWGYNDAASAEEYAEVLGGLFDALRASPHVSGFCYTQYMDTGQETNGLLRSDGTPKLDLATLRRIVTGQEDAPARTAGGTVGWPD